MPKRDEMSSTDSEKNDEFGASQPASFCTRRFRNIHIVFMETIYGPE
jgi:hypothetical protein